MFKFAFVLLTAVVAVLADPDYLYDLEDAEYLFREFMVDYEKQYSSQEEEVYRFQMFKQSLYKSNNQNMENPLAEFGINEYSDLSPDEFATYRTGSIPFGDDDCSMQQPHAGNPPDTWDWREHNAVGKVKEQGMCGSCWAFSAIGNVEGQYAIKYGNILSFSEKELVDCDRSDNGCDGGSTARAFTFLQQAGGVEAERDYPYAPEQDSCSFDRRKVKAQVSGCDKWRFTNEDDIKNVLYTRGPLSITIDPTDLGHYGGGIMFTCLHYRGTVALHGVLLVGYGSESGVDYWIFKNSWGTGKGENGYIRVKRGINACGMMDFEFYSSIIV